jgi:hypothetical protein
MSVLYLIGSLRNDRIPILAETIRAANPDVEVFDEWYSAGPEADDHWKAHQQQKGLTYAQALEGYAAKNVFDFDRRHLNRATHALLVLPAGKSGHMEITYAAYGVGAKTAILLDPEDVRWDVMYQFIPTILNNDEEIQDWLKPTLSQEEKTTKTSPGWNLSLALPYRGLQRFSGLGQGSMLLTTGGVVSNTLDSSEPLSDISTLSTTGRM